MRVKFVEWGEVEKFGSPHEPDTRLKAQEALGYAMWPLFGEHGGPDRVGVLAHCPSCGTIGALRWFGDRAVWTWNGDADKPTLVPSVHMRKDEHGCGFHCFVRDGQIIDAGTPAH